MSKTGEYVFEMTLPVYYRSVTEVDLAVAAILNWADSNN